MKQSHSSIYKGIADGVNVSIRVSCVPACDANSDFLVRQRCRYVFTSKVFITSVFTTDTLVFDLVNHFSSLCEPVLLLQDVSHRESGALSVIGKETNVMMEYY